jgi:hypothetical protein
MSLNQPPITNNPIVDSWTFETTKEINLAEQRYLALLNAIKESNTFAELKEKVAQ